MRIARRRCRRLPAPLCPARSVPTHAFTYNAKDSRTEHKLQTETAQEKKRKRRKREGFARRNFGGKGLRTFSFSPVPLRALSPA